MTTYDAAALDIILSNGSKKARQAQLTSLAAKAQAELDNRVECPDCGSHGPHDDNGCSGSQRAYCCSDCGNHFE